MSYELPMSCPDISKKNEIEILLICPFTAKISGQDTRYSSLITLSLVTHHLSLLTFQSSLLSFPPPIDAAQVHLPAQS
jgi:hypothetical protein